MIEIKYELEHALHFRDAFVSFLLCKSVDFRHQLEVFPNGEILCYCGVLRGNSDCLFHKRALCRYVVSADVSLAARRFRKACEHAYRCGFSCAVHSEKREQLALFNGYVKAVYR